MQYTYTFKRVEKKYLINEKTKNALLDLIGVHLYPDEYGKSTVCSIYLDTKSHLLIRRSMDARTYKEKLRLRTYGVPTLDSNVFLEIKKKFKGVVYKRRVSLKLKDAKEYIQTLEKPFDSQIMREIDYAMHLYDHPKESMLIAYEREAYYIKNMPNLRLTFDSGVRYRKDGLLLENGNHGKQILPDGLYILEVKTDGAMPIWLSTALSSLGIFPTKFSKYAKSYMDSKGEDINVSYIQFN